MPKKPEYQGVVGIFDDIKMWLFAELSGKGDCGKLKNRGEYQWKRRYLVQL
jgi:hypothetical protein